MARVVNYIMKSVKNISMSLRPDILANCEIMEAIKWEIRRYEDVIQVELDMDQNLCTCNLDTSQSMTVFRIFQEALNNVICHAHATRVEVGIKVQRDQLKLQVKDNGRGITNAQLSGKNSLGILGMKERACLIGGTLKINGIPDNGTIVVLKMPVASGEKND
jgi:signal transduction histidine kinase